MERRSFILAGMTGAALMSSSPGISETKSRAWFELKLFYLRNDLERSRLDSYLSEAWLPAMKRAGYGAMGCFDVFVGPNMPMLMTLTSFPSLAGLEASLESLARDAAWGKALDAFDGPMTVTYTRIESRLLRAFASLPALELPAPQSDGASRVFELRTYESRNLRACERKIKMFDEGEIEIFRKCGMMPVFFGQTITGAGMPSLTYMLAYNGMEAREEVWRKFANHPDWKKLRAQPGFADREIVSNISSCFLRPTAYSDIR